MDTISKWGISVHICLRYYTCICFNNYIWASLTVDFSGSSIYSVSQILFFNYNKMHAMTKSQYIFISKEKLMSNWKILYNSFSRKCKLICYEIVADVTSVRNHKTFISNNASALPDDSKYSNIRIFFCLLLKIMHSHKITLKILKTLWGVGCINGDKH